MGQETLVTVIYTACIILAFLSGWVCKRLYCRRCDQECNDCTMRVLENLVSQGYWVTVKPKEEDEEE